jgi:hypothetical protein
MEYVKRPGVCMHVYLVVNADLSGHVSSDNDGRDLEAELDADVLFQDVASCVLDVMDKY